MKIFVKIIYIKFRGDNIMLKFVICDDNENILDSLSHMLEAILMQHSFDATIAFSTTNADKLLEYIEKDTVDVLILDINLHNQKTGLEIAETVRKTNKSCYIIFTTGYFEHVLTAFKYKTFDYICKPVTKERLEETILRLFEDVSGSQKKYIRLDTKNTIINESDVQYIKREGMKIIFHTQHRDYDIYSSFAKIEESLPSNFVRCHKSFIANVNNITKLEPMSNLIYFDKNSTCDIGPKYKDFIMEVVENNGNFK